MKVITYYSETDQLEDLDLFMSLYGQVSEERRRKIDSYAFPKDRRLSLGVAILLRKALEDLGEDPDSFSMDQVGKGKPALRDSGIHFNLSHSEERVMCSVSDCDVGCDVEKTRPADMDLAKSCFFGTEYRMVREGIDEGCRSEQFYRLWTLKESFMKVTGIGLELPLDSFRIYLGSPIVVDQDRFSGEFFFKEYSVNDGYRYAVCSRSPDFEPRMRHVAFRD